MQNIFMKTVVLTVVAFGLLGCESGSSVAASEIQSDATTQTETETIVSLPDNIVDAINSPKVTLSQDLKDAITFMYNEEALAHDIYLAMNEEQPLKQLQNIASKSEVKHIKAVDDLAIKYDLNMTQYPDTDVPYSTEGIQTGVYSVEHIQELYDLLYDEGIQSAQAALEVGCKVEVVDVEDLDRYIALAVASNASDVLSVFNFLIEGSYKHYWTFDDALKKMNITDGCCSLGNTYCQPEYPGEKTDTFRDR